MLNVKHGLPLLAVLLLMLSLSAREAFLQDPGSAAAEKSHLLINSFRDPDPYVQGTAIETAVAAGRATLPVLIQALQETNPEVRACSAIALGKIAPHAAEAIPALIRALDDTDDNLRWYATLALGRHGPLAASAIPALVGRLHDRDDEVRWVACLALRQIDPTLHVPPPSRSAVIDSLEFLTPRLMQGLHVPGVSIVLVEGHRITWSRAFGLADAALQTPADTSTLFEACSMSKPVFAALALMLVDERRLQLDRPLARYKAEEFTCADPAFAGQLTARMIMAHTSGLPNWRKGGEEREGPLPIFFKPGTRFSYSGEGFYYLQRVVETITGEPLAELAQRRLFARLAPGSASYIWTEGLKARIATGHDGEGHALPRSHYLHANAAYTLYITPAAFARLMIALLSPQPDAGSPLLSGRMRQEMVRHQVRVDTRTVIDRPGRFFSLGAFRGLGWAIDSTATRDILYHSGANQTGFRCYAQYDLEGGSGIVIMTNGMNGSELWSRLIAGMGDW